MTVYLCGVTMLLKLPLPIAIAGTGTVLLNFGCRAIKRGPDPPERGRWLRRGLPPVVARRQAPRS